MVVAQEKIEWQVPAKENSSVSNLRPAKKRKQYTKLKSILVLSFIVGLTGAIGAETIQLTVVQGAQVRTLEKEISVIKAKNDLLQMEADKLRSVGRIESAAISMGMEKPLGKVYMAGTLPAVKNQEGAPTTQTTTQTAEVKPTALHQFSKLFTSFFASTQR